MGFSEEPLFRVVHPEDGRDWTDDELTEYAIDNTCLVYCDLEGFLIDEYGGLYFADECGNWMFADPDRFQVVFPDSVTKEDDSLMPCPLCGSRDLKVWVTHVYDGEEVGEITCGCGLRLTDIHGGATEDDAKRSVSRYWNERYRGNLSDGGGHDVQPM